MAVGHQGIQCIFLISFTPMDRTRLRKGTTSETQTLPAMGGFVEIEVQEEKAGRSLVYLAQIFLY